MRLLGILRMAARSLNRNKMRSFLTMLGIMIGVAAVIAMLAIGQGAKDMINSQIASLGTNLLLIFPGAFTAGGVRSEAGTASRLSEDDAVAIKAQCPAVQYASPMARSSSQVKAGGQNWRTSIFGAYPNYLKIRDWDLAAGTMFTDADERGATKVCVLGQTVITNIFGQGANPVGQIIRIKNLPFTVVGTLIAKGQNAGGQDQDDCIIAPFSTVQKKLIGATYAGNLIASAVTDRRHRGGAPGDQPGAHGQEKGKPGRRLRLHDPHADRHQQRREPDRADAEHTSGQHRARVAARGRHRHHEHHARLGHGAHAGNRHPHGRGRKGPRRAAAVSR